MTKKEYNSIFHAAFEAVCKVQDVQDVFKASDIAYIYDVRDSRGLALGGTGLHKILTVAHKSVINDQTLKNHGFDPDYAEIRLVAELRKPSKMMYL